MLPAFVALSIACTRGHPSDASDSTSAWTPPDDGLILASDLRGNEWFTAEPTTGAIVDELWLNTLEPDVCVDETTDHYCLLFQSRDHISEADPANPVDEIVFTYADMNLSDGTDDGRDDLISRVYSVDRQTHATRWHFQNLDFSHISNSGDYCTWDPADPCQADSSVDDHGFWACSLHMAHDAVITDETATSVGMWVVDSRNSRMLHVELDRSSTCAVVDTVIDNHIPDWDIYDSVNSMNRWTDGDNDNLLMSVKGSFPDAQTGQHQFGESSAGKIIQWRRDMVANGGTDPWRQVWEFPPMSTTEESFLSDPHGSNRFTGADGHNYVVFAHSLGHSDGTTYGDGTGGSIGLLRVDDDVPVYMYDALLPKPDALQFPRDVTPLADGSMLVTDSGCLGDGCQYETYDWIVHLPEADPAVGVSGAWRADHSQQVFRSVDVLHGPLFKPANLLFSSEWIAR